MNQVNQILTEMYDLRDLNKEEDVSMRNLRLKIQKHNGQKIIRSKKINILDEKLRKIIRGE